MQTLENNVKTIEFNSTQKVCRGQVWLADLGQGIGSEQGGIRPVLIISNEAANMFSTAITICPLTSKTKRNLPTHVFMDDDFLSSVSIAMLEQITTISKKRLVKYMGKTNDNIMIEIDNAIRIQTAIQEQFSYDKAFEMISIMHNIKSAMKQVGELSSLKTAYHTMLKQYKDYCEEYKMDYQIVITEYNQQKTLKVM